MVQGFSLFYHVFTWFSVLVRLLLFFQACTRFFQYYQVFLVLWYFSRIIRYFQLYHVITHRSAIRSWWARFAIFAVFTLMKTKRNINHWTNHKIISWFSKTLKEDYTILNNEEIIRMLNKNWKKIALTDCPGRPSFPGRPGSPAAP